LKSLFPEGEITLERRFPDKNRIADAVWERHKIIFEIQCSSISEEEVKMRCFDYEDLGYQIVWILHDRKFNKRKVSAAELYLRSRTSFFITPTLQIYDQVDVLAGAIRLRRVKELFIDLRHPLLQTKPLQFAGDRFQIKVQEETQSLALYRRFIAWCIANVS
jgi:competence protein CoiA